MTTLPPELARLEAQLAQLYAQIDAGQITPAQAQPVLSTMFAFDAYGYRWTVSPQGRPPATIFLVEANGAPLQPADPSRFVRPQPAGTLPTTQQATSMSSLGDLLTPPAMATGPLGMVPPSIPMGASGPAGSSHPIQLETQPRRPSFKLPAFKLPAFKLATRRPSAGRVGVLSGVTERLAPHKRLILVAAAILIFVVIVVSRTSNHSTPSQPDATRTRCPASKLSGIPSTELAELAGCLARVGEYSMLDLVTVVSSGTPTFADGKSMSRAGALYAAVQLYQHGGGTLPAPTQVAVTGVDPSLVPTLQQGVSLGLVPATWLEQPTATVNRGEAAVILDAALTRLLPGVTPAVSATDAGTTSAPTASAQARLAARKFSDTPAGAAFGFNQPLTTTAYVTMYGRAIVAVEGYRANTTAGGSGTSTVTGPDLARIADVITKLSSANRMVAASVLVDHGSDAQLARGTAQYAGYAGTGLTVTIAIPTSGRSSVTIQDGVSGQLVASGSVRWSLSEGTWRLASWPSVHKVG